MAVMKVVFYNNCYFALYVIFTYPTLLCSHYFRLQPIPLLQTSNFLCTLSEVYLF